MATLPLLHRLDAHDRALLARWAFGVDCPSAVRWLWRAITHAGGATVTIALALFPFLPHSLVDGVGTRAAWILTLSHLAVQLVKRRVGRPRPSHAAAMDGRDVRTWVAEPDRFSFPSGHSAAAMSIAMAYATAFPPLAIPLYGIAVAVGVSRVYLGVHYPGDVIMGQAIALGVGSGVLALAS